MRERWSQHAVAAVGGVVAAGTALSVGYLVAAITGGPWPVDAVGVQLIDWAPGPLKDFAVRELGTADRPLLRAGICVVLAATAAIAGVIGRTSPAPTTGGSGGGAPVVTGGGSGRRRGWVAVGVAGLLGVVGVGFAGGSRSAATGVVERLLPATATLVTAVVAMALVVRRPRARAEQPAGFDRRQFLLTVSALAVVGAASVATTRVVSFGTSESARTKIRIPRPADPARPLPAGVQADVPGVSRFITPNSRFYRVDTLLQVPRIDPDQWELRVHGMVDRELRLSFRDLLDRRLVERDVTLTCVSNEVGGPYVGNARWIGVPIADVLAEAGVRQGADAVKSTSVDGLTIGTPLAALTDGRDALFAVAMNGEPLPFEHGFPVRMVVPGLYGYVSATKWVVDLEVTRFQDFSAYWTDRGWAAEAPIKTAARIDVPKGFDTIKPGPAVAAGVAWAQHRGIRKVEVQIDDGPWQEADLAAEDTVDTWRQWTFRWTATPGNHKLTVRATDANGETQTDQRTPPRPDGSTGLHNTVVMVQ